MNVDWDIVRQILRVLGHPEAVGFKDKRDEIVRFHLKLMHHGGLVTGKDHANNFEASGLTQRGRYLVDKMGDDDTWEDIKAYANEKALSLTVDSIDLIAARVKKR